MIDQKDIDAVIENILASEGGFVNSIHDDGGATNYGITLATLRQEAGFRNATIADIKHLDIEEAKRIYQEKYCAPFVKLTNACCFKFIVNGAVQHGVNGMVKILQRALNLKVDGILGSATWTRILVNEASPTTFLADIVAQRCEYYADIVDNNPTQLKFIKGWLNRLAKDLR